MDRSVTSLTASSPSNAHPQRVRTQETNRRLSTLTIIVSLLAAPVTARADDIAPIPTRWMAAPGVERLSHRIWEARGPISLGEVSSLASANRTQQGRVAIIVEEALYAEIAGSIFDYQVDLAARGYSSIVALVSGATPESLRAYLVGLYEASESLVGVTLVGNVPYVIYEMLQDWDGSGGNPPEYEDFPCDIFFMDMNGIWLDDGAGGTVPAGNGKYDVWSDPQHQIEIWASRMRVDTLPGFGQPATVLNNYFRKNNLFRHGALVPESPPARGLVYVDDDWGYMVSGFEGDEWCVSRIYGQDHVTSVYDVGSAPGNAATAADYRANHMPVDYQLVFLRSHGYPGGHGFYRDYRANFENVFNSDYVAIDPGGLFYSLYVCSACDYTAEYGSYGSYLGGTIVFNDDYGLVAWGSTKTGGMWNDAEFYTELAQPSTIAAAFVNWFNRSHARFPEYAARYWYGMVLIGDAILVPNGDYFPPRAPGGLVAHSASGAIDLSWNANSEGDLHHYDVYRAILGGAPEIRGSVDAPDTTYEDFEVLHDTTYVYWVTAADTLNNGSAYSEPDTCTYQMPSTGLEPTALQLLYRFPPTRPNPFNALALIPYDLPEATTVTLCIFDPTGRLVKRLLDSTSQGAGHYEAHWDGRDAAGNRMASGVYLCKLDSRTYSSIQRIVLLR